MQVCLPKPVKDNGTLISGGTFIRYYFPSGKVLSYVEAGGALGAVNTKYEYDDDVEKNKTSVNSWTLGGGVSMPLSEKAAFDLMLGVSVDNNEKQRRQSG